MKVDAGEKELRKAFEETTKRNISAMIEHGNETRKLVRELEEKIQFLQNALQSREEDIKQLRIQLASIQTKLFSGGTA
jgi:predicted RNase H-like nuclease (RuvC/YqgF family)